MFWVGFYRVICIISDMSSDDKLGRGSGAAGSTYCETCRKNTYNSLRKVCKSCRGRNARDGPLGF